jgi:hypothetical protein
LLTALLLLALAATAQAAPTHPRKESLDVTGLNHACGVAVDSKGDLYASSAGDSKVKVYNPSHVLLTEISDANTPCGLAVTTTGDLYVSEQATGEVVRFKPNKYPFEGTPTYGSREVIDSSGKAKGIAVDRSDNRLYVAEGNRVSVYDSAGSFGEANEVQRVSLFEATGGTFKLRFGGQATGAIPFNASAEAVKTALVGLSTIGAGNVSVEKPKEMEYLVTFVGALGHADVEALIGIASGLTGGANKEVGITEKVKGFSGHIGEGTLSEASGVAPYAYPSGLQTDRYLWVADAKGIAADRLYLFGGTDFKTLALRREVSGTATPDGSFGFGATKSAYLAADPGNRGSKGECIVVGEPQACTAGHLFLYDAAHKALDEFDATGEYLDRTANPAFADAEPTAVAIDRSGGSNDGTLYVSAGSGAGAKALAFGPLKAPKRATLSAPLSHTLANAEAVATDSRGDLYAGGSGSEIRVYDSSGKEVTAIEDAHKPWDLAVDSTGKVYVLDKNEAVPKEAEVTYYTPSKYPPDSKTTYTRHEPVIATPKGTCATHEPPLDETTEPTCNEFDPVNGFGFPEGANILKAIAVNPGPGEGKDRLFVTSFAVTHEYDSAANGSTLLNEEFGGCVGGIRQSIAVNGASGTVYIGVNPHLIYTVDKTGGCLRRFENTGAASGKLGSNPNIAVDQVNGHVLAFDGATLAAREYDAAGSFVAEFGKFTDGLPIFYRVAVDNACAIHEPPLDETTTPTCKAFDPANGTAYVAFDDTAKETFDVSAFGVLDYGPTPPTPEYELKVKKTGTGSGKVTSTPAGIDCGSTCSFEFEEDTEVTLSQAADSGSKFVKWGGACSGTGECKVWMSEAKEVTAEFESTETEKFSLKVVIEGLGSGKVTSSPAGIECTSTCSFEFFKNTNVTLTAAEGESSKFASWTGCDAKPSATKCEVSITGPREVKAKFNVETPLLTVVKEGAGSGKVTSSPAGIDCGATCTAEFTLNEAVTLKAKEEEGSTFSGWEVVGSPGACPGTGSCLVTMSKAKKVKAAFDALPQAMAKQAHPVLYDEATLRGEVDPSGLATEYRFEYLSEEEYEDNGETFGGAQHTPMEELAPGSGFVAVEAQLIGLEEGTEYRFLLRAMNSVGPAEDEGAFETLQRRVSPPCPNSEYRTGLSANLPDCRAYELVTPAQTEGLTPHATGSASSPSGNFSNWLTVQRDGGAGERLSYFTDGTLPGFEGNGVLDGYRAERGAGDHPAGGWQSALFSPDYAESAPGIHNSPFQLGIASDQLYSSWEITPEPETFPETLPHGVYLSTPGTGLEVLGQGSLGEDLGALSRYVSAGGAHAIFTSDEHLEEEAAPKGTVAIYDRAVGEASAEVVSVKPGGSAFGGGEGAAYVGTTEDGAAVAFSVGGVLYLHRAGETIEIAAAPNTFAGISEGGTWVFYAATAKGNSPAPLYACDTEVGPCAGSGAHSSEEIATSGIFAEVSPDGSHAFFSSTEELTGGEENDNGEEAEAGKHNFYAWDGSETRFVGGLAASDFEQNAFADISEMNLAAWTRAISFDVAGASARSRAPTRSTPDGGAFVFQSHARLTAYDNEGVGEIYRYDPTTEEGERLLCVSCDPTGAPPSADALLEDVRGISGVPLNTSTMVASLTDSGQEVFFQSFDRLLPEDANDAEDVYEWRAKGTGEGPEECKRQAGCLALISSGQGETPSFLYAMSADGHDVFIHTKEKLVGADLVGSPSIYDARERGGIPEPVTEAPCQGDACQGQGTETPVLPNPATTGEGESPNAPVVRRPCAKGKHRVKGRCVKAKHRKHRRHRRAHANRGGSR